MTQEDDEFAHTIHARGFGPGPRFPEISGQPWLDAVAYSLSEPHIRTVLIQAQPGADYRMTVFRAKDEEIGVMVRARTRIAREAISDLNATLAAQGQPHRFERGGGDPPGTWRLYFRPD